MSVRHGERTRTFLHRHELQETRPIERRLGTPSSPGLPGAA